MAELRRSPDDNQYYTFQAIKTKYAKEFNDKELENFWRKEMKPKWVVQEEEDIKRRQTEEAALPKEEQEWYQKWLRRQENKPKNWAADWKDDGGPIDPNELRRNPEDKEFYTFEAIKKKYAQTLTPEMIEGFWRKDMKPQWV